jgi:hypothetical protein
MISASSLNKIPSIKHWSRPTFKLNSNFQGVNIINPDKPSVSIAQYIEEEKYQKKEVNQQKLFWQPVKDIYLKTTGQVKYGIDIITKIPKEIAFSLFLGAALPSLALTNFLGRLLSAACVYYSYKQSDPIVVEIKKQSELLSNTLKSKAFFLSSYQIPTLEEKYNYDLADDNTAFLKKFYSFATGTCLRFAPAVKSIWQKILLVSLAAYCLNEAFKNQNLLTSKVSELSTKNGKELLAVELLAKK